MTQDDWKVVGETLYDGLKVLALSLTLYFGAMYAMVLS